jgi:folate-binding protein YgfZ
MSAPTKTPAPVAAGAAGAAGATGTTGVVAASGAGGAGRPGRLAEEYAALRRGCALAAPSSADGADTMEMLGPDRHRFLNAYVTCEVKGLAAGQGTYGFFTSAQGRILADVVVLAHADRFWLELPPGRLEPIAEHLRKYLIADRVEMRPLRDVLPLTLAGPGAAAVLAAVDPRGPAARLPAAEIAPGFELPREPWAHARAVVSGVEVAVQRTERLGVPALTLWVPAAQVEPFRERLLTGPGLDGSGELVLPVPVGREALEVVRTEAGLPRFGQDFGPQNFPQETGATEAVSFTKGCYLGQEVVARIHYRGGVQKTLCGLVFDGPDVPAPGTALLFEGREAGTVGTAVHSLALDRPIGLAILHRRAAAPGSRLELTGGGHAEVRALPLVDLGRPDAAGSDGE